MTILVTKAAAIATLESPGAGNFGGTYHFRLPGGLPVSGGAGTGGSDAAFFLDGWREIVTPGAWLEHDTRIRGLRVPAAWVEPARAVYADGGTVCETRKGPNLLRLDSHTARALADALAERFPGQSFTVGDPPGTGGRGFFDAAPASGALRDSLESAEIAGILEIARNSGAVYVNRGSETVETVEPESFRDGFPDAAAEARRLLSEYRMAEPGGGYALAYVGDIYARRSAREDLETHKARGYIFAHVPTGAIRNRRDPGTGKLALYVGGPGSPHNRGPFDSYADAMAEAVTLYPVEAVEAVEAPGNPAPDGAAFGPDRVAYLLRGRITLEETAESFSRDYPGGPFAVGDPEYRLADDPESPGFSWDYPTRAAAMSDAGAAGLTVRDMTGEAK